MIENYKNENSEMKEKFSSGVLIIRQILWNQLKLEDIAYTNEVLSLGICSWINNELTKIDFKVLWSKFYTLGLIGDEELVKLLYIIAPEEVLFDFQEWMKYVLKRSSDFGTLVPSLNETIRVFRDLVGIEVDIYWDTLASKISSFNRRPEYYEEIITNSSKEDLIALISWISWENRSKVTNYLIDQHIQKYDEKIDLLNIEKHLNEENAITNQMPASFNVIGEKISELPANALDMDTIGKIPQQYLKEWAPKFVYSQPEIKQKIRIFFPGGEGIGHSAIIIKTNEGMILLDFGLSVANNSIPNWLPLLEKIDVVLLSHAHLDHSGSIPLLMSNNRKLPLFAHKDTKLMSEMLWNDTRNILSQQYSDEVIQNDAIINNILNESNIMNALNNFNQVKVGEQVTLLPKVEVTAYNAAHLFGSFGYELNIDGKRLLYTGDFNSDGSLSFKGAQFATDVDLAIFDGTYYGRYGENGSTQPELKNLLKISDRILIPAFSMGRSQEMLFQLKKLNAEKNWKIYLTGMGGKLVKKLNITVGSSGGGRSTGISILPTVDPEMFTEKTIVIAGQGMLQAGTSRNLLEYSADDPKTSVVMCGYQAPNSLGYHLLQEHNYLTNKYKQNFTRISISGHTRGKTLDKFIDNISGKKVMVHTPEGALENLKREDIQIPINLEAYPI